MKDTMRKLVQLEEGYSKIKHGENVLKSNKGMQLLKEMKRKFEELKIKYIESKKELEDIQIKSAEMDDKIDAQRSNLKILEEKLYEDCGSDLKLIEKCEKDINKCKIAIKDMENKDFKFIEQEEVLKKENEDLKKSIIQLKNKFENCKKEMQLNMQAAKEEVKIGEKTIQELEGKIPEDVLKIYDSIKKLKPNPVVPVKDNVCLGCNIKLPRFTESKLKQEDEIVYCDNCGRIIYIPEK